jgi:hypothetical protein
MAGQDHRTERDEPEEDQTEDGADEAEEDWVDVPLPIPQRFLRVTASPPPSI